MCRLYGLQYVGEAGKLLHMRVNGHRYDIGRQRTEESPVAEDFNIQAHGEPDTGVMVLELT